MTAFVQKRFATPYTLQVVVASGTNIATNHFKDDFQGAIEASFTSDSNLGSAPHLSDSRPLLANYVAANPSRKFMQLFATDIAQPGNELRNSIGIPAGSLLFAAVASPSGSELDQIAAVTLGGRVAGGSGIGQQAIMPLEINTTIAAMRMATHPSTWGAKTSESQNSGVYDPALPEGDTRFVAISRSMLHEDEKFSSLLRKLAQDFASKYDEQEPGDPTSVPYPGDEARRSLWSRPYSTTVPSPARGTFDVFITTNPQGQYKVLTKGSVDAANAACRAAMVEAEKKWLMDLQRWTRDGPPSTSVADSTFTRPALTLSNEVDEAMAAESDAWYARWRELASKAVDPSKQQARKDELWRKFKAKFPNSTVTREAFELNPAAYLPDSEWLPASTSALDKPWWSFITDGLGWLGSEAKEMITSTDGSTLAAVLGVGAATGIFGSSAQLLAILVGGYLLFGRGGSQEVRLVSDAPKQAQQSGSTMR